MRCNICDREMSYHHCEISAGDDWYPRRCISFKCDSCPRFIDVKKYDVETSSIIIEMMLRSNNKIKNFLFLLRRH